MFALVFLSIMKVSSNSIKLEMTKKKIAFIQKNKKIVIFVALPILAQMVQISVSFTICVQSYLIHIQSIETRKF